MFTERDKLPMLGILRTLGGSPIPSADIIIKGLEHRELAETNWNANWWNYLGVDEYNDIMALSYQRAFFSRTFRILADKRIFR
ncbi:MAG: hypothetical protein APR53_09280 [Methanoculleus sp. SDB]|nr:MAG: hypothetical protein APR53_09280 [Methanoculleus sp. SDB]